MFPKFLNNLIQEKGLSNPSSISPTGWIILLVVALLIDAGQLILDVFAIGLIANRFIDIGVGIGLLLILLINRYHFEMSDFVVLAGSFIAEEIPGIDVAPFWTYDVWRFRKKDLARRKSAI